MVIIVPHWEHPNISDSDSDYESENKIHTQAHIIISALYIRNVMEGYFRSRLFPCAVVYFSSLSD